MIEDTCVCGAKVKISFSGQYPGLVRTSERYAHEKWLKEHSVCRIKAHQEDEIVNKLEEIRCGIIDVETECQHNAALAAKEK